MNYLELAALGTIAVTVVLMTWFAYRYYAMKVEYGYREKRLEYDDLLAADGGTDDRPPEQEGGG